MTSRHEKNKTCYFMREIIKILLRLSHHKIQNPLNIQ
jgi:hypothetical protein